MSKITIGMLPASTILDDNDLLPIYVSQEGTKKITAEKVKESVFNIFTDSYQGNVNEGDFIVLQNNIPKKLSYDGIKNYLIGDQQEDIENKGYASINDVYGCGKQIPNNSDLDDYVTLGKYYYNSASSGTSIDNYPTEDETIPKFSMTIEDLTPNTVCQTVRPVDTYAFAKRTASIEYTQTEDTVVDPDKKYYEYVLDIQQAQAGGFNSGTTYYKPNNYIYFVLDDGTYTTPSTAGSLSSLNSFKLRAQIMFGTDDFDIEKQITSSQPDFYIAEGAQGLEIQDSVPSSGDYVKITINPSAQNAFTIDTTHIGNIGAVSYYVGAILPGSYSSINDFTQVISPTLGDYSDYYYYYYIVIEEPGGQVYDIDSTIDPSEQKYYERSAGTFSAWSVMPEIEVSNT